MFFISNIATADNTDSHTAPVSIQSEHPLALAQQELEQAKESYNKNDIDAVQKNLEAATKLLQSLQTNSDEKTKSEAAKLAIDIQALLEKINHPSDQHEGVIARIWHRSTALVEHEVQHLGKSWSDTSRTNSALKHLDNAKLHFNYAEFDLFHIHDPEKVQTEITNTLTYVSKIEALDIPKINKKLESIKKDIQTLVKINKKPAKKQEIINALEMANIAINKASTSVNPKIQVRAKEIVKSINNLKADIEFLEDRKQYDAILKEFDQVNSMLRSKK